MHDNDTPRAPCPHCGNTFIESFGANGVNKNWHVGCKPCSRLEDTIAHVSGKNKAEAEAAWETYSRGKLIGGPKDAARSQAETEVIGLLAEVAALKARIRKFEYLLGHPVAYAVPSELAWLTGHHGRKQVPCIDVYSFEHKRATLPLYGARGWENQLNDPPAEVK